MDLLAILIIGAGALLVWRHKTAVRDEPRMSLERRTEQLYEQAKGLSPRPFEHYEADIAEACGDHFALLRAAKELFEEEGLAPPDPPPVVATPIEEARYIDYISEYINKAHDPTRVDRFVDTLKRLLPDYRMDKRGAFTAARRLTNLEIDDLVVRFFSEKPYFKRCRDELASNVQEQKQVLPRRYRGTDCAYDYFKNTPLRFLADRPFSLSLTHRMEHTHILGGSGQGKTQLIQYMISRDLKDDCTVVVIDNQRQMIPLLANLDLPIDDVTMISPSLNLGINLFDIGYEELRKRKDGEAEINAIVELLEYVLGSIIDAEFTPKQQVIFQYAIQLTVAIPDADIRTFLHILEPKGSADYADVVDNLPKVPRDFITREFDSDQYTATKKEISWRIWSMLKNPTFARIFSAPDNPIDMNEELANSRLVLIDTDLHLLSEKGSSLLGRFFIALILQVARRRFAGKHRPVYLYIDEAPIYFDKKLATMLEQARKANIGLILAHQGLDNARAKGILNAILANTATKFVGGVSDHDTRTMAANMNTTADFIQEQGPLQFAMSSKEEETCGVYVPFRIVEQMSKRTNYNELVREMEENYGYDAAAGEVEISEVDIPDQEIQPSSKL